MIDAASLSANSSRTRQSGSTKGIVARVSTSIWFVLAWRLKILRRSDALAEKTQTFAWSRRMRKTATGTTNSLHNESDDTGESECHTEAEPRFARKRRPPDAANGEGVGGPDHPGECSHWHETAPWVPDSAAGERDDGAPARDESAHDDQAGAVPFERLLRPHSMAGTALARKDSSITPGAEMAPGEVAEIVTHERSARREDDQEKQARIEASRRSHTERDDCRFTRKDRQDGIEKRQKERYEIREDGVGLEV
jgi:hypothetical protein